MSDEINWIPVGIWSAGVFVQIDSAIRSWWMNRGIREGERRLIESDWSKIRRRRDEVKRGFRMWMERRCCPNKSILEEKSHFIVPPPLPNDYDWSEWIEREPTSIYMAINHPMPNAHRYVMNLRRYSFLAPDVYTDIARVIYTAGEKWWWMFTGQLDDRTIASAFYSNLSGRICVIFTDTEQRSYSLLSVPAVIPVADGYVRVLFIRRGDGRLRIVYASEQWHQREVFSIDYYMIRISKKQRASRPLFAAVEVGRQSIVIPGHRNMTMSYIPGAFPLHTGEGNTTNDFVITIDQRGDFRLHHYDEWERSILATDIERRSRKAMSDFTAILPAQLRTDQYFNRYYKHIVINVGDGAFAKRQLYPPSMKYRSAEAICQSIPPNADLSMIKSETGIDIFDGIIEDREKPMLMIYLPSDDEL